MKLSLKLTQIWSKILYQLKEHKNIKRGLDKIKIVELMVVSLKFCLVGLSGFESMNLKKFE